MHRITNLGFKKLKKYEHKSMSPYTPGGKKTALINSFTEHREKIRVEKSCWVNKEGSWVKSYKEEDVGIALLEIDDSIKKLKLKYAA
ncbi:MAG: hypothetical protein ACYTBW_01295 [Planctomycetota bacterium]|jgi:hypothetical protein